MPRGCQAYRKYLNINYLNKFIRKKSQQYLFLDKNSDKQLFCFQTLILFGVDCYQTGETRNQELLITIYNPYQIKITIEIKNNKQVNI